VEDVAGKDRSHIARWRIDVGELDRRGQSADRIADIRPARAVPRRAAASGNLESIHGCAEPSALAAE